MLRAWPWALLPRGVKRWRDCTEGWAHGHLESGLVSARPQRPRGALCLTILSSPCTGPRSPVLLDGEGSGLCFVCGVQCLEPGVLGPLTWRSQQADAMRGGRWAGADSVLCSPHRPKKLRFHPKQLYFSARQGELQKVLLMLGECPALRRPRLPRCSPPWPAPPAPSPTFPGPPAPLAPGLREQTPVTPHSRGWSRSRCSHALVHRSGGPL